MASSDKARRQRQGQGSAEEMESFNGGRGSPARQLRNLKRFLEGPGASSLNSEARANVENRISTLERLVATEVERSRLSKWRRRYRSVIFFEWRKLDRMLQKLKRDIARAPEESPEHARLTKEIARVEDDINYVKHFPQGYKYISLFAPGCDTEENTRKREKIREAIKAGHFKNQEASIILPQRGSQKPREGGDSPLSPINAHRGVPGHEAAATSTKKRSADRSLATERGSKAKSIQTEAGTSTAAPLPKSSMDAVGKNKRQKTKASTQKEASAPIQDELEEENENSGENELDGDDFFIMDDAEDLADTNTWEIKQVESKPGIGEPSEEACSTEFTNHRERAEKLQRKQKKPPVPRQIGSRNIASNSPGAPAYHERPHNWLKQSGMVKKIESTGNVVGTGSYTAQKGAKGQTKNSNESESAREQTHSNGNDNEKKKRKRRRKPRNIQEQ